MSVNENVETSSAAEPLTVTVRGRTFDVREHLPLTMRQWRPLNAKGVDPLQFARLAQRGDLNTSHLELLTAAALAKALGVKVEEVGPEDLDELTFMETQKIAMAVLGAEQTGKINRPTSTDSSSSPKGGDGDRPTLMN